MHVRIHTGALPDDECAITDEAASQVRMSFNPSTLAEVDRLKALAAAFISECDRLSAANPAAGRELAVAKTNMQQASMWGVAGATQHLT